MNRLFSHLLHVTQTLSPAPVALAHCDGPCGVYDPAQARVAAESVITLTKKILELGSPDMSNDAAAMQYRNTLTRYVMLKEQEAQAAKDHLLVLWTDYFKPEHLEAYPELHTLFWKAAKECSYAKHEVSLEHAEAALDYVRQIHEIFWATKGRQVEWVTAAV